MAKLKSLKGISQNMVSMFGGSNSSEFLRDFKNSKYKEVDIDLLKGIIKPKTFKVRSLKPLIADIKNWFKEELEKADIKPKDITSVLVTIKRKDAKVSTFYTIRAEINAKDNNTRKICQFVGKNAVGWMWGSNSEYTYVNSGKILS
jgi:hypothetical protein